MNVDSLLIYSCQSLDGEGDFISLSIRFIFSFYLFIIQSGSLSSFYLPNEDDLRNRKLEFRFDTGSGAAVLRSKEEVSNAH